MKRKQSLAQERHNNQSNKQINNHKKITISSNLPITWFDSKDSDIKEVTVVLQPSDSIDVNYSFIPKTIGDKEIQLFIYTDAVPQTGIIQTTTFLRKCCLKEMKKR